MANSIKHPLLGIIIGILISNAIAFNAIGFSVSFRTRSPSSALQMVRKGRLQKEMREMNEDSKATISRRGPVSGSNRREKSEARKVMSAAERKAESALVDRIMGFLGEKKRDLEMIKSAVDELRKLNSAQSLRSIVGSQNLADYQLSFAWDDSAVSFVGTGLHKVPLARLDYFFMTLGKGRLLMREVIRIIGPFPTVLNTLVGKASVEKGGEGSKDETLKFVIDSVVDGTGKELVGEEPRLVDVPIIYASDQVIVGFAGDEEKLLIFTREEDVDSILFEKNVGDEKKNKI